LKKQVKFAIFYKLQSLLHLQPLKIRFKLSAPNWRDGNDKFDTLNVFGNHSVAGVVTPATDTDYFDIRAVILR